MNKVTTMNKITPKDKMTTVNKITSKDKMTKSNDSGNSKAKRVRGSRARHWCFTEYTTKRFKTWKELDLSQAGIRYFVYQLEQCPTTGRLHLQCYIEFFQAVRML